MGIMYKLMKHRNLTMDFNSKHTTRNKSDKCRLLAMDGGLINNETNVRGNDGRDYSDDYSNISHQHRRVEGDNEKRFTAEHILQLCKFLAEKSKRNKNLHKQQQSPKKLTKTPKTFQFQTMDYDDDDNNIDNDGEAEDSDNIDNMDDMIYDNDHDDDNDVVGIYQSHALPLLSTSKSRQHKYFEDPQTMASTVLSSRLSPDINALNISSSALQQQNQQQHHLQQDQLQQHQPQQHQQGKRDILLKIRHQIFERKRLREKGYEPQVLNAAVSSQVWRPW